MKLAPELLMHDVKICINPDCGLVVLNKAWKETHSRVCDLGLVKITAACFKKKFLQNKQVIYMDI